MQRSIRALWPLLALLLLVLSCDSEVDGPTEPPFRNENPPSDPLVIPSNASIDGASLRMYCAQGAGSRVRVYRVNSAWDNGTVTWNSLDSAYLPGAIGTFYASSESWIAVPVTAAVRDWFEDLSQNYGLVLVQDSLPYPVTEFRSREVGQNGPRLIVCYSVNGTSICDTIGVASDTYVSEDQPDGNLGGERTLMCGATTAETGGNWTLLRFNFQRGAAATTSIGDRVWNDTNQNGVQDTGESGVAGVVVQLLGCENVIIRYVTTDGSGQYLFDGLVAGDYRVRVRPPDGWQISPANQGGNDDADSDAGTDGFAECITLEDDEADMSFDFGLYTPSSPQNATIGDRVWNDSNQNGIQDSGEPSVQGATVLLLDCQSNQLAQTTTDGSGSYRFITAPGNYRLRFLLPGGWTFSPRGQGGPTDSDVDGSGWTQCIGLSAGETDLSWDAGMYQQASEQPGAVGDQVWNDANRNGIRDRGEGGVPGVVVRLLDCDGNTLQETTTDGNGDYRFNDVEPGDYRVRFVRPNGWEYSPRDQGSNNAVDSDADQNGYTACFEQRSGENDMTIDAGINQPPQSFGCTRDKSYWEKHAGHDDDPDLVGPLLPIHLGTVGGMHSVAVTTSRMAWEIFREEWSSVGKGEMQKLYAELLAAKLNFKMGADDSAIRSTVSAADQFLAQNSLSDWEHLPESERRRVQDWRQEIERYNKGDIGPGKCGSSDDDDDD